MKLLWPATLLLLGIGPALADDVYDAVYVSDPAVCERAGEADMNAVLYDLAATAIEPRRGFYVAGEMMCTLVDQTTHMSPIASTEDDLEIFATARCNAYDIDFRDQVIITPVSQHINASNGDTDAVIPDQMEVISMRADLGGEGQATTDGYAGIYTRCDAIAVGAFDFEQ
ncbi:MAG: hypothetical protein JWR75_419 [Devosia sp.]|nr:hypothetical protein [Devosia sp.]